LPRIERRLGNIERRYEGDAKLPSGGEAFGGKDRKLLGPLSRENSLCKKGWVEGKGS